MSEIQVSMTKLRQNLGNLVNRAAYGGQRIVLISHGEPKAAIIGVQDLQRLQQLNDDLINQPDRYAHALATADQLRERIREWQKTQGLMPEDTVETLRQLREGRADELHSLY